MKALLIIAVTLVAQLSLADGFKCENRDGSLNVKVFNHVDPKDGTRNGSIMVLSDPRLSDGYKTIAKFTDLKDTLDNQGAIYMAKVDLRVSESNRKGELIAGTKLGHLKTIKLWINFTYGQQSVSGELVDGRLTLTTRGDEVIYEDLVCERYLKN